tara:strand:- start:312 stop:917 length:606 start_codon:yes stop_codon:yes gene_type:complete
MCAARLVPRPEEEEEEEEESSEYDEHVRAPRIRKSRKRRREADEGYVEDEDGMQLALALSASLSSEGLPNERQARLSARNPKQAASASSSSDNQALPEEQKGDADDNEDASICGICFEDTVGGASSRPDHAADGGCWGFTPCCSGRVHFDCLGQWLRLSGDNKKVESTSGPVDLNLGCPFCRHKLSSSSSRMLSSEKAQKQ